MNYKKWNYLKFNVTTGFILGLIYIFIGLFYYNYNNLGEISIVLGAALIFISVIHYYAMKDSDTSKETLEEKNLSQAIPSFIYALFMTLMILGVLISNLLGLAILTVGSIGLVSYTFYRNKQ